MDIGLGLGYAVKIGLEPVGFINLSFTITFRPNI